MKALYLNVTVASIIRSLIKDKTQKLKLKEHHISLSGKKKNRIMVFPPDPKNIYYSLQILKMKLPLIIVSGIPTVSRCVVSPQEKQKKEEGVPELLELLVEGPGLRQVLITPGITCSEYLFLMLNRNSLGTN